MYFVSISRKMICSTIFTGLLPRFFSSNPDLKVPPFMVVDYLVSTFGFSPAKAAAISKPIAYLKSPHNPDAVRGFLQHQGFGEDEIKTLITKRPSILCSSPQNNLGPNLLALQNMGLSASALTQIILSDSIALQLSSTVPRIMFWRDFVGGDEALLVKVFKRNRGLISHDINGGIANKFLLLQSHRISTQAIKWIVCTIPSFIISSVSSIEDFLKRAKELGFDPESRMFKHALLAMTSLTKETMQKKMELFKSFGWSEDEFLSAVRKAPSMVAHSEKDLQAKMNFFLGEAKLDPSYISSNSMLLMYCLEKRLRPRHHVLLLLESKELSRKRKSFTGAMVITNNEFVAKYILPHTNEIPELYATYLAACASRSRSMSNENRQPNPQSSFPPATEM